MNFTLKILQIKSFPQNCNLVKFGLILFAELLTGSLFSGLRIFSQPFDGFSKFLRAHTREFKAYNAHLGSFSMSKRTTIRTTLLKPRKIYIATYGGYFSFVKVVQHSVT